MVDPRPGPEFTTAHHVVLNGVTYLVMQIHSPDENAEMVMDALARSVALCARDTPRTQSLCAAADALILARAEGWWRDDAGMRWSLARLNACGVLARLYFWRMALAMDALEGAMPLPPANVAPETSASQPELVPCA